MAWNKEHDFFKTAVVLDSYDFGTLKFGDENLFIKSRKNGLRRILIEIFQKLGSTFNLEFLLDDKEYYGEEQMIFTISQQIEVVKSINDLYDAIEKKRLELAGDNLFSLIQKANLFEKSQFDFNDNESIRETIWTLELIRRFFEESIKENKIIVKFENN